MKVQPPLSATGVSQCLLFIRQRVDVEFSEIPRDIREVRNTEMVLVFPNMLPERYIPEFDDIFGVVGMVLGEGAAAYRLVGNPRYIQHVFLQPIDDPRDQLNRGESIEGGNIEDILIWADVLVIAPEMGYDVQPVDDVRVPVFVVRAFRWLWEFRVEQVRKVVVAWTETCDGVYEDVFRVECLEYVGKKESDGEGGC